MYTAEALFGHEPRVTYSPGITREKLDGQTDYVGHVRVTWTFAFLTVSQWDTARSTLFTPDTNDYSGECYIETRDDDDNDIESDALAIFPTPEQLDRWGGGYRDVSITFVLTDTGAAIPPGGGGGDYVTETELTAAIATHAGEASAHHDPVTLSSDADNNLLSLGTQEVGLDAQNANKVLAGPTTGGDTVPSFRALVAADLPGAMESARGALEIATTAEAQAGSLDNKIITPAKLQDVTATTARAGVAELSTEAEMDTGTDTERIITPALLRTRELDIAELLFTEDDGLLLLGPGSPMTPDAWVSLRGQAAEVSGAFNFRTPGKWAGTRAITIERAAVNLCTNPSFESSVTTNWSAYSTGTAGGTRTQSNTRAYSGEYALILTKNAGAENDRWGQYNVLGNSTSGESYSASCWVWLEEGATARLYLQKSSGTGAFQAVSQTTTEYGRWVRLETDALVANATGDAMLVYVYIYGNPTTSVYVDAVQVEQTSYITSYLDGSLGPGYAWDSTPHASSSTRTVTVLYLNDYTDLVSENQTMSFSFWLRMPYDYNATWPNSSVANYIMYLDNDGSNYAYVSYNSSTHAFRTYCVNAGSSGSVESSAQTFGSGDWVHLVVTIDNGSWALYVNGSDEGSSSVEDLPAINSIYIGGGTGGNFTISEVAIFDRALTASEVAKLYAFGQPLTDVGAIMSPADNLGPLAGAWPILFGSQTHTGDTSYSEAGSNQESRFGWGTWVSGSLQFEAVIKISDSGDTGYAMLQWNDSGTWRDVEGSEVSITGSTSADLVRSGVIYLSPDEREYRVVIKTSDSSQTITIYKAALICTPGGLSAI
jgi:hypothetical protein